MTDWPTIQKGLGKLTPDRWKRIGAAVFGAEQQANADPTDAPRTTTTIVQIVSSSVPAGSDRVYVARRVGHLRWLEGASAWATQNLDIEARSLAEVGLGSSSSALAAGSLVVCHLLGGRWWFAGQAGAQSGSAVCSLAVGGDRITTFVFTAGACATFPSGTATNIWAYGDDPPAGATVTVLPSVQTSIPVWACWDGAAWVYKTHVVCPVQVDC